jgi:hypothetical protein
MSVSGIDEELGSLSIGTAPKVVPTTGTEHSKSTSAVARIDVGLILKAENTDILLMS